MKISGKALPPRAALLLTFDFVVLVVVAPLLFVLPLVAVEPNRSPGSLVLGLLRLMAAGFLCQMILYYHELYNLNVVRMGRETLVQVMRAFGVLFLLLAINLTQSRLGVLGWLIAHGYYICVWAFTRWRRIRTDIVSPAIAMIYPVGLALFTFAMFTVPAVRNRTIGGGSSGLSDQSRKDQFAMMWPKLFQNPFGYGGGRSGDVLGYRLPGGLLTVDSYIITMLLEYGVIGFLLYFGTLTYGAYKLTGISYRHPGGSGNIALPLATFFVIAIEVKAVLSQADNVPLVAIFLGLSAAVIWSADKAGSNATATP